MGDSMFKLRFSVRALFVITLVAAIFTCVAVRSFVVRSNIGALRNLGVNISRPGGEASALDTLLESAGLRHMRDLTINSLNTFESFGDEQMEQIAKLPDIQHLTLRYTTVSDDGFRVLAERNHPSLRCLVLEGVDISDEGIVHLAEISRLRTIYVSSPFLSDMGIKKLRALRPDIFVHKNELDWHRSLGIPKDEGQMGYMH